MKNTKYARKWFSPKALKRMAYGYVNGVEIPSDVPENVQKKVLEMVEAIKFVTDYSKDNNFVTERLRTYFVGETIKCDAGFEVWAPCRGKPTGTIVAHILSTHNKSTNIHVPTISIIESIAPTS